jgi:hypothetical protein
LPVYVAIVRLPRNTETVMLGKRVQFDEETWNALELLARVRMQNFQELADGAFAYLLRKHGRPTDLKAALRQSIKDAKSNMAKSFMPDFLKRPVLPSVRRGPKYLVLEGPRSPAIARTEGQPPRCYGSRAISRIVFPLAKCSRRIRATVSTTTSSDHPLRIKAESVQRPHVRQVIFARRITRGNHRRYQTVVLQDIK